MNAGPTVMKMRGPYFAVSAPNRELRNTRNSPDGMNASPADRERDDERAEPVDPARRTLRATLLDVSQRRPDRDDQERDVDEEHRPPRHPIDEHPTDERPEDRRRRGCRGPEAERATL